MNINDFIKLREDDWQRLDQLITKPRLRHSMSAAEVRELGQLYRAVTSDLAQARRDYPNQRITQFLNQLLTRTHNQLYQNDLSDYRSLLYYFFYTIPQSFRKLGGFILTAFLMFMIPAMIGFYLTYTTPDTARIFGLSQQQEILANQSTWTDIPVEARPVASSFIMTNNIQVAILAFGGGVLFGIFTFYVLVNNGLHIGAVLGLAYHYGQGQVLMDFIFAHGVVELSVIFMAGGAGLALGWALFNPGLYTRRDSLALMARQALPLIVISIPLLVMAGTIEGFISPSDAPFSTKVLVGLASGALMYSYLFLFGREIATPQPRRKTIRALETASRSVPPSH